MSARGTRIRIALAVAVAVGLASASAGFGAARAQDEAPEAAEQPPLRVAVAGSPPFVVGDDGTDRLAIDIWTAVAGERPSAGIGNGVWMALVTMTTVGYGDRVPRTTAGRIVTGVWMLIAMLIAGSLIAFMSTALTMSQLGGGALNSAEDLRNERVGVVEGTTSETFATRVGARPVATPSVEAAVEAVSAGRAAAVVFDRPALQYHLRSHPDADLVLAEARYEPTGYGFAIALDSSLRQSLDVAILSLQRTGRLTTVVERWLGGG